MMAYEKLADDKQAIAELRTQYAQTIADLRMELETRGKILLKLEAEKSNWQRAAEFSQQTARELDALVKELESELAQVNEDHAALLAIAESLTSAAERRAAREERDPSEEVWDARRIIDAIKKGEEF